MCCLRAWANKCLVTVTGHEKRKVSQALKKDYNQTDAEKLVRVVDFELPPDAMIKSFAKRSETIAKLIKQLKGQAGPLKHCTNDQEYWRAAIEFFRKPEGKSWSKY
jgi:hypothetical protein